MYNAFKVSCYIDVLRTNWRYLYLLLKRILYAYLVDDKYLNWLHMVIFRFGSKMKNHFNQMKLSIIFIMERL